MMQNPEFGSVADFLDEVELSFKRWEESVALYFAFDEREVEIGTKRQGLGVNLSAAADVDFA